jgi:hypothetical protein
MAITSTSSRVFGPTEVDRAVVDGIELELATPAQGRLHVLVYVRTFLVYVRTFNIAEPEELLCEQSLDLDAAQLPANGGVRIPLSRSLHTAFPEPGLIRRVELSLAFNGPAGLALRSVPRLYPANYGRSLGVP